MDIYTGRPSTIAFFDVDGTLIHGTSSARYLAHEMGHLEAIGTAETAWHAGLTKSRDFEELAVRGWAGSSPEQVRAWLSQLPLVDGIAEVVSWCSAHSVMPVLATLACRPVGAWLCETFGFAGCSGPILEMRDGRYTGAILESCDEYAKRDFAVRVASEAAIPLRECVAIGDSRSDLPLFAQVGLAIAFNADPQARAEAHVVVGGLDLRVILPAMEKWVAALPGREGS